jgi:fumarylpyruvate hydrolase
MAYAFSPAPLPSVAIAGGGEFPVRRIYCVGRNYAAHAIEMGFDGREPPFFFLKPADAILPDGSVMPYPPATKNLHHEIELVVALGAGGGNIAVERALDHVLGYAVGLDMTRRDLQQAAKEKSHPWDMGKSFDYAAPCGPIHPVAQVGHPSAGPIDLKVNGQLRQQGDLADMIWSVPETIAYLSGLVELHPGDLIYTGTPDGVGPVAPGDRMDGRIDGLGALTITIGRTAS